MIDMTDQSKPRRWRPRFSLRTLLIFVALTCAYLAALEATKRQGVPEVKHRMNASVETPDASSSMPFVVGVTTVVKETDVEGFTDTVYMRVHFVWFFGWTWETPIRWEIERWWSLRCR